MSHPNSAGRSFDERSVGSITPSRFDDSVHRRPTRLSPSFLRSGVGTRHPGEPRLRPFSEDASLGVVSRQQPRQSRRLLRPHSPPLARLPSSTPRAHRHRSTPPASNRRVHDLGRPWCHASPSIPTFDRAAPKRPSPPNLTATTIRAGHHTTPSAAPNAALRASRVPRSWRGRNLRAFSFVQLACLALASKEGWWKGEGVRGGGRWVRSGSNNER